MSAGEPTVPSTVLLGDSASVKSGTNVLYGFEVMVGRAWLWVWAYSSAGVGNNPTE